MAAPVVRRNAQTRVMEALTGLMGFWGVLAVMFAALAIYVFDIGGFQKRKFEEEEKEVRGLDFKRVHGDLCCCTQCGA